MRIAVVGDFFRADCVLDSAPPIAQLSIALCKQGHDVTVYSRHAGTSTAEKGSETVSPRVVQIPAGPAQSLDAESALPHMGEFADRLAAEWETCRPDVVHAESWGYGTAAQLVADKYGIPAVQALEAVGARGVTSSPVRQRMTGLLAKKAARVGASCDDDLTGLVRMGAPRARVSVLRRGIDVELFSPEGPTAPRTTVPRIVTLLGGNGLEVVLRALPGIPDAEVLVVKLPETTTKARAEAARASDLIATLSPRGRVRVVETPSPTSLAELLRSADVAACADDADSVGTGALAAMACGVPVVASASGAHLDLVTHDVTGLLVKPGRPAELARGIRSLLGFSFRGQAMGSAGRTHVRSRYCWDRIAIDAQMSYDAATGAQTTPDRPVNSV